MSSQLVTANRKTWEYAKDGDVNGLNNLIRGANGKLDVDAYRDEIGFTALMWAAWMGHLNCVTALLSAGAQVDIQETNGWTVFIFATL